MREREVVELALRGEEPPYVPWNISFTGKARESFEATAGGTVGERVGNHLAGVGNGSFMDPTDDLSVNVVGTIQIMKAVIEHKVPRVLYASSMTAYGHPASLPVSEDQPCVPVSYYGITKLAAERYLMSTGQRDDLDDPPKVTAFRMFNVYGPRQSLTNPYQGVLAIFMSAGVPSPIQSCHCSTNHRRPQQNVLSPPRAPAASENPSRPDWLTSIRSASDPP